MQQDEPADELRTIPEVAAKLRIGRSTVYALINSGALPAVKIGKLIRVPASRLAVWVERQAREAEAAHQGADHRD